MNCKLINIKPVNLLFVTFPPPRARDAKVIIMDAPVCISYKIFDIP